jgi:DNA uptake protein ComE-like DNA-binding protein
MISDMKLGAIWRTARIVSLLVSVAIAGAAVPVRDADTPQQKSSGLVDINRASTAELKSLPGIKEAYAVAIVKNRPYKNKKQLLSKQVIPEAAYGKIKSRIIAKE